MYKSIVAFVAFSSIAFAPVEAATVQTLLSFNSANGSRIGGEMIIGADGKIYGTMRSGGINGSARIFSLDPSSSTFTTLANLVDIGAAMPTGRLFDDGNGNLVGVAQDISGLSSGIIYQYNLASGGLSLLGKLDAEFQDAPWGGVVKDAAGNVYGTSQFGGTDHGTVYKLEAGATSATTLHMFDGIDGEQPAGELAFDGAGNIYGTTPYGGPDYAGTIFRLDAVTHTVTTAYTFEYPGMGTIPWAGLTYGADGNFYGVGGAGGIYGAGTIYKFDPTSNDLIALYNFAYDDGRSPMGELLVDAAGNIFGTTNEGGPENFGSVFRLDAGTNLLTILASFSDGDALGPIEGLTADRAGNLYGSTLGGGAYGQGFIFKISNSGFVPSDLAGGVPEPQSWAMMIIGFGLVGASARRRRLQMTL